MITITLSVMAKLISMMVKVKKHDNHDNFYDNSTAAADDDVSLQVDCLPKHLLCDALISNPFDI